MNQFVLPECMPPDKNYSYKIHINNFSFASLCEGAGHFHSYWKQIMCQEQVTKIF
jgi:hypothetical protein